MNAMQLTDLLDLQYMQNLQDNFAQLTGLTVVLIDPGGYPLTTPGNFCGFYALINSSTNGTKLSLSVNRKLCTENKRSKGPIKQLCPYSGLQMGAVPIFYEDIHLASWVITQARIHTIDKALLQSTSIAIDVPIEKILEAVQAVPCISLSEFDSAFSFMGTMAQTVTELARVSYDMVKNNANLVELTEQLDSTAQMLTKFTNSADVGMYVNDFFTGELLQANEYFANYSGRRLEDVLGKPCWQSRNPDQETFCEDCPHDRLLDERGHPGTPITWERYYEDKNRWMQFTNQAIYWVDGRLAQMVTFIDITQTKQMQQQLARLAYYDRALQLPNDLKLGQDLEMLRKDELQDVYLICFDVLSLRTINDVYSRSIGDKLLNAIARWTENIWRKNTVLYRTSGDGFCLLVQSKGRVSIQRLAAKISTRFEEPWSFQLSGEQIRLFCSITMAVIHLDDRFTGGDELLGLIERTLNTAKRTGKVITYDEAMDQEYKEHLKLQMSLKNCVKEGMRGFDVHYQPIVDPATGKWCYLEALCRWTSPECGIVSPLVFIQEAEQMGLIGAIGRWVLDRAVGQCKGWGLDKLENFVLDVNLSPTQIADDNLVASVLATLNRHDFPGEKLSLEITESTELNFTFHTRSAIEKLRDAGILVALDDFGTGYSSLNNLKNLPVSYLKTERAFLHNIENDRYLQHLICVMVELAHAADMKLIAEGVETYEQMRILLQNGVDFLQGYLFSKPLDAATLEQNLDKFYYVSGVMYDAVHQRLDSSGSLASGIPISLSSRLYQLLISCMQLLVSPTSIEQAVDRAIALVGEELGLSRVYVFWRDIEDYYSNVHEWCARDVEHQKAYLSNIHLPTYSPSWAAMLREKDMIVASDVSHLLEIAEPFVERGVLSMLVLPVWQGEMLLGFIGFEDHEENREWLPEEVLTLHNLCAVLANAMEKKALEQGVAVQRNVLSEVLNTMDITVFVSDLDTGEILFANDHTKRLYGDVEGKPCWKMIQGQEGRCSFCKAAWLQEHPIASKCVWESVSPINGREYKVYDTLVSWVDGRQAHLEYLLDITDMKDYQRQLQESARMEAFTHTHNRNALLSQLRKDLWQANQEKEDVVVCFVDIDRLKETNDRYGHKEGDNLILAVVDGIRECLGVDDIIGRYGGDEFVFTLHDMTLQQAKEAMQRVQHSVQERSNSGTPYSFSFGLASTGEIAPEDSDAYVERIIALADSRMFQQKGAKKKHAANIAG